MPDLLLNVRRMFSADTTLTIMIGGPGGIRISAKNLAAVMAAVAVIAMIG